MKKNTNRENQKIEKLILLLKEKEQEAQIAKQKAGFFARKHAEALEKLGKNANVSQAKPRKSLNVDE
jgi:hypothetical protein